MRNLIFAAAFVAICASTLLAQSAASSTLTGNSKKLIGCLKSDNGKYILVENQGKRVSLVESPQLALYVHREIAVRGSFNSSSVATNGISKYPNSFAVTKLEVISESCAADKTLADRTKTEEASNNGKPSPYHLR